MEPISACLVSPPPVNDGKQCEPACVSDVREVLSSDSLTARAEAESAVEQTPKASPLPLGARLKQARLFFPVSPDSKDQQQQQLETEAAGSLTGTLPGEITASESPLAPVQSTDNASSPVREEERKMKPGEEKNGGREVRGEEEEEEGEDRQEVVAMEENMDTSEPVTVEKSPQDNNGSVPSVPGAEIGCCEGKALKTSKPKVRMTKAERDALRAQREREREERERVKEEAKAKREAEKQKREQERRDKLKRREKEERERKEKREREERERKEKREREEQEKRDKRERKEAERKKREEERKKREEEKKQMEMEKESAKQEKIRKTEVAKTRFLEFFSRVPRDVTAKKESDDFTFLTPFPVQPGMTLATPPCSPLEGEHKNTFDKALQEQEAFGDYLADCKMKRRATGRKATNHQPQAIDQSENGDLGEDVMIVEASGEPSGHDEGGCVAKGLKFKLLQFHLDHRPAYWGTWQKKSSKVNPRNPFKTDKGLLDYEVDSADEWEEEEPGESISDSEGEEDDSGDDPEEDDGFFVPHGYLSDDEGQQSDGEKCDPTALAGDESKSNKQKQLAKAKAWEAEFRRKCQLLKPIKIGCLWCSRTTQEDTDIVTQDEQLLSQFAAVSLVELPIRVEVATRSEKSQEHHTNGESTKRPVPEEAMPDLISLVHGSTMGIARLMKTFRVHWGAKMTAETPDKDRKVPIPPPSTPRTPQKEAEYEAASRISKKQLKQKILAIAVKEQRQGDSRPAWYVHGAVMQQYGTEPGSLMPLVPVATPSSERKHPQSCEKSRQVSPETPCTGSASGNKKGVKRKVEGMQSVKTLFEALNKSPPNYVNKPSAKKPRIEPLTCGTADTLEPPNKKARHAECDANKITNATPRNVPAVVIVVDDDSADGCDESKENTTPTTSPPLSLVLPFTRTPSHGLEPPCLQGVRSSPGALCPPLQECKRQGQTFGTGGVAEGEQGIDWQVVTLKSKADANIMVVSADIHELQ